MYQLNLSAILGPDLAKECKEFKEELKETRLIKVMKWKKKNLKSYGTENSKQVQEPSVQNKCWVVNLSNTPPIWDTGDTIVTLT